MCLPSVHRTTMKLYVLLALLLLAPVIASAEPHQADMTRAIVDPYGHPVLDPSSKPLDDKDCSKCTPLTIGRAIAIALNGTYDDEKTLGWQQRYDRASLAKRIRDEKAAVL